MDFKKKLHLFTILFLLIVLILVLLRIFPNQNPIPSRNSFKVAIKNGCGKPGIAGMIAQMLQEYGYDVIQFGNAEEFDYEETVVLIRSSQTKKAQKLARRFDIPYVFSQKKESLPYDAEIILGKNFGEHFLTQ